MTVNVDYYFPKPSEPLLRFFAIEIANGHDQPRVPTLGTAHDSLLQAPDDVIANWLFGNDAERVPTTGPLIEFGRLLHVYGEHHELDLFL